MNWVVMTLLLTVSLATFAHSARRRWRLMRVARRPERRADRVGQRINAVLLYMFGQKRLVRYATAGWAHIVVFFGFLVLLLNSIILWVRGYVRGFDFWGAFALDSPLGVAYALLRDIFTLLVIIGVLMFFWNRAILRLKRLTLNAEGLLILGIIFTMMVADFVYEGVQIIRHAGEDDSLLVAAMPFASLTALMLSPLSEGAQHFLWHLGFWAHAALVLVFLNLLPYGKHFHVITVLPNVFCRNLEPSGRLPNIADIEGRLEREETLGVKKVGDFSWKSVLDLYTCTECGRCSEHCPAANTGKQLSPKHLSIELRDHMYKRAPQWLTAPAKAADAGGQAADEDEQDLLVPQWIKPEVPWACTTCAACEQECPVFISYIDKIVDLRRHLVMERGDFPEQLQTMFRGLETVGNPYGFSNEQRAEWAKGLNVPLRSDRPDAEWLFWVGCAPSFDDRARKIARATAKLLLEAGVDFAILGPQEQCNGDPARRAGHEYLFQMLARANVETMNGYNVKKIVAACPHCYNTLKNEYPDFGGRYEVVHHSELLAQLVRRGQLQPRHAVKARVAYHDACYLGRHNGVYDPPRAMLRMVPGVQLVEAAECRDRGMCCGAGGAQMWKEEEQGDARVNHVRTNQLLEVLPGSGLGRTIASSCPFCLTMLTDGLADQGHEGVQTLDIAEILHRAVKGPLEKKAATRTASS